MKTTAAVLKAANSTLSIEELDIEELREDEVLVKVVGAGICHTDLGLMAAPTAEQLPIVLGHEGSGVIEKVGRNVKTLSPGDHVVLSYNFDGTCDNCSSGVPMHCRQFIEVNLTGARADGTTPFAKNGNPVLGSWFGQSSWATYAVANERNCVRVAKDLPLELLGPLGCGIQTGAGAVLNSLRPEPGTSIAVFAVGSVGQAAILGAVVAGCEKIIAVDIDDSQLQKALGLGATHAINSSKSDPVEAIRELTGGLGVHYTVDCIGMAEVVRNAIESLQRPGTCVTVGYQGMPNEIAFDQGDLLFGKTLRGVIEGDGIPAVFIPEMIRLYQDGRFPFDKMIDTYPFSQINEAIEAVHHHQSTKAVLTFRD